MRLRVETEDGVLVVYDAALPPEEEPGGEPECSGFLAYYLSNQDGTRYVFGGVLDSQADLAEALLALQRDLGVDVEALGHSDERVEAVLTEGSPAPSPSESPGRGADRRGSRGVKVRHSDRPTVAWEPATRERAVEIMEFDPRNLPAEDETSVGGVATPPPPPCASVPGPPQRCDSPLWLFVEGVSMVAGCGGDDGGGGPCVGPCCRNPDPCCGSTNPCCPYCCGDQDCDGIPNNTDPDIDGDGIPNGSDSDVDGDGIPNGSDADVDGDGLPNGSDPDVNNDGTPNSGDGDVDGDGIGNGSDPDVDGDGIPNGSDPDIDGDGIPNGSDPEPGGCTADCPGACCTKATGACALKKTSECTGSDKYFKGKEVPCSPNPCCVIGTNAPFPVAAATVHSTNPSRTLETCVAGRVDPETFLLGDVTISAICDGTQWCAALTGLNGPFSLQARLLPGQTEVTGPNGNTTSSNSCAQVGELKALGYCPGGVWFMISAIVAHENVHAAHLEPALELAAPLIEQSIETICVPHTPAKTQAGAIAEIRNTMDFNLAVGNARAPWDGKSMLC